MKGGIQMFARLPHEVWNIIIFDAVSWTQRYNHETGMIYNVSYPNGYGAVIRTSRNMGISDLWRITVLKNGEQQEGFSGWTTGYYTVAKIVAICIEIREL